MLATESTSRHWGRAIELPAVLQYKATIFPPECDDVLRVQIVLEDVDLAKKCEFGLRTFVANIGISVGPDEWRE